MAATIDVNPANQAYPPPPGDSQALPIPSAVAVAALPAIQPSFSQGTAQAAQPSFDVATQNNVLSPVQEVIVTENGNFATNNTSADIQSFKVSSVVMQGPNPADSTTVYQIALTDVNGNTASLTSFGVDFTECFANFPAAANPKSPENIPSRPISAYNDPNTIVVPVQDSFGNNLTQPSAGDIVTIGVIRQGASLTVLAGFSEIDVFIAPRPAAAITVPASGPTPMGNITPGNPGLPFIGSGQSGPRFAGDFSGGTVGAGFVGSGQQLPPFLGTFEVENQVPLGLGLPANVFV